MNKHDKTLGSLPGVLHKEKKDGFGKEIGRRITEGLRSNN